MNGETKPKNKNILKCRDDIMPVNFVAEENSGSQKTQFILQDGSECSWAKPGEPFGIERIRQRIEPWLTALCQSEHLSLLLGSGLSNAVNHIATNSLLPGMNIADFKGFTKYINEAAKISAQDCERSDGNIEDQIRVANELLRGAEIAGLINDNILKKANELRTILSDTLLRFANGILEGESKFIKSEEEKREKAFNYLVTFLMSFASRSGTRDRLHIFTTNYDRFIEAGAEVAGMHLLDRFVGTLSPIFRSSRLDLDLHYNPPGIRGEPRYLEGVARFTKLHGSLDWMRYGRNIRRIALPFGSESIEPYITVPGEENVSPMKLMIYPNAAKDRETASYPYVELFRDFAAAICRPNHTLIAFGYSFGDEHINRIIEDMLTIPSTHLVVISYNDPLGRIMKTYDHIGRHAQISLMIGDHIGEFTSLVDHYLPKPAIDRTTSRMAELLKARFDLNKNGSQNSTSEAEEARGE
ncbi:MAG: SIR2 family protein [Candidatus Omnitrophota bacterium]